MNLRTIGLNHETASLDVREALAFSPDQTRQLLEHLTGTTEAVLLSTCNRTEFTVASESDGLMTAAEMLRFLLQQKGETSVMPLASQIYEYEGIAAVEHLFSVTASLDSMVLGETQILSQVKSAYLLASEVGTVGPVMHGLFQTALKTAKRIASETALFRHRVSIPSIAVVDFALRIFERLSDKTIYVFGAGEMASETLGYLIEHGASGEAITILNRHREKAEKIAQKFGGSVLDWDKRFDAMVDADLIVSATGAEEPIVTKTDFHEIKTKRKGRPLFVLDLAVPRDFEPTIAESADVYLYSIDDLQATCRKNREERDREIPKAEKIVKKEALKFVQEMNHRKTSSMIRQLQNDWSQTKEAELTRLFNKLPQLGEKEQGEIRYAFDRLVNKFLHPPLESLRDESKEGVPHKLLDALAKLFRLKDSDQ